MRLSTTLVAVLAAMIMAVATAAAPPSATSAVGTPVVLADGGHDSGDTDGGATCCFG